MDGIFVSDKYYFYLLIFIAVFMGIHTVLLPLTTLMQSGGTSATVTLHLCNVTNAYILRILRT